MSYVPYDRGSYLSSHPNPTSTIVPSNSLLLVSIFQPPKSNSLEFSRIRKIDIKKKIFLRYFSHLDAFSGSNVYTWLINAASDQTVNIL